MRGYVRAKSSTKRSLLARLTVCLLAGAAIIPASAGSSQAITGTVDSSSFGISTNISLLSIPGLVNVAATPVAAYPAGPTSNSTASVSAPGAASAGVTAVTANGDPLADTATASSSVANLNLLGGLPALNVTSSGVVGSSCATDGTAAGTTATATVTGLSIPGAGTIPDHPTVNQKITIGALGINIAEITLNEQTSSVSGGLRKITVNALHLKLLGGVLGAVGSGDVIVGHSECTATVQSVPSITSFSPVQGPQAGGTAVTINGTNFLGATTVLIDGVSTPFVRNSLTQVTATTLAHAPATGLDIRVVNGAGTTPIIGQKYTFLPTPTVTSVSPSSGLAAGGNTVTLTGTNFTGATAVNFGATPATSYTVVDSTHITAVVPAGSGSTFVQVTAPGGTSATGAANAYQYYAVPTLTSISPTSGPTTVPTTVTLTGTNFTADSTVTVDGATRPVTYVNATTLQITTATHAAGAVPVVVTTPGGTTSSRTFTYLAVPTVSGISPDNGTLLGGTTVTVSGTGLTSVTGVTIGGNAATITGTPTDGSLTFTTPLHLPGPVSVVLTGPGSITTSAGTYTYTTDILPPSTAPTVTSLTPNNGPQAGGGTPVVIAGTNFTGATSVLFGTVPATSFTVNSATQITATAPAAASSGPVSVTVTNPSGTSAISLTGTYLYQPLTPGLTSISPNRGPAAGGTSVTLTGSNFTAGSTVQLDAATIPSTYVDATHITVTMPAHTPGTVQLYVSTTVLQSGGQTFTYIPATTVTGMTPTSGTTAGGTVVTVTGTNLDLVDDVNIGGVDVTPGGTATSLTFTTPAHAAGATSVLLTNSDGLSLSAGSFTYVPPAPTITSLTPNHGPLAGGNTVTIAGTNLDTVTAVTIGGSPATIGGGATATSMTVTAPSSASVGATTVTITGPGGSDNSTYTYDPLPTVSAISPSEGPDTGGTSVTITGTNLGSATSVNFGATTVTSAGFTSNTATTIVLASPAHAVGTVDVTVVTASGTSATSAVDRFTYFDSTSAPTVTAVSPNLGSDAGGTAVTLTGTGFTGTTGVDFGGSAGVGFTVVNDRTITVTSPAHAFGTFDVIVATTHGTSTDNGTSDDFTFVLTGANPVIASINPVRGPIAGGTPVTITGVGFTGVVGASGVTFGGTNAASYTVDSDTQISAVSPAHAAGQIDVIVTRVALPSVPDANSKFTFVAAATITGALSPNSGPTAGGTTVTITGTDFFGATGVTFDGVAGTDVSVSSDTSLTVKSPPHAAGAVNVIVNGVGGDSGPAGFTYNPAAPTVTGVNPNIGKAGDSVTVTGTGFLTSNSLTVGGNAGLSVVVVNDTTITFTLPAHAAGTVDVVVGGPGGFSANTAGDNFTYAAVPVISSLSPNSGPSAGNSTVTVTGTGFTGATVVNFGATPGTDVAVSSDTSLTVTSPAHAAGQVNVQVIAPGGTSNVVVAGQYTFRDPANVVTVLPNFGPAAGGTTVFIAGTGFTGTTAVQFDGVNGRSLNVLTDILLSVISPPGTAGPADVVLLGPNGASAPALFTYNPPPLPVVSSVSPVSGPAAGNTTVTVTGTGFTNATAVNFGATPGTDVAIASDTSLTVTSPAHAAGQIDVTVVGPGGTSTVNSSDRFTYIAGPAVTSLNVTTGSTDGGTAVTITGSGFVNPSTVKFGTVSATNVTVVSPTSITVTSPAQGVGAVDVRVTNANGTSAIVGGDVFTYTAPTPIVSAVSPATGTTLGSTSVTITGSGFTGATAVDFGGSAGTAIAVSSGTSLTVTTPAHAAGLVDVTVTAPGGTGTRLNAFEFIANPAVSSVVPNTGSTDGGDVVVINGTGFAGATAVRFDNITATITNVTGTAITVTTPAHIAGAAVVTVTGPGGTSVVNGSFTYSAPATTVTGVTPANGSTAGGTTVTVTGTGFSGATVVSFGGTPGTAVAVSSPTSLTVTTPAHASGLVAVAVTAPGGTATLPAAFTYDLPAPTVGTVAPTLGTTAGGTLLTLSGTGFTGATSVTIGGIVVVAPNFTVVNDSTITLTSPPHAAGNVTITVITPGGTSPGGPTFSYVAPGSAPVIGSVSPARGPAAGGTTVTITGVGFSNATQVTFNGVPGTNLVVVNDTTIRVTAPAGTGDATVIITTPFGSSTGSTAASYGYVPLAELPVITAITPNVGPVAGGTRLTINGSRFDEFTTVTFDGVPGTNIVLGPDVGGAGLRTAAAKLAGAGFRAAYSNVLTVDSPAHAQGPVTVTVTNAAGSVSFVQLFTFIPVLQSSSVSIKVKAGSTTKVEPTGADYLGLEITVCSDPGGLGNTKLAGDSLSCSYTAPPTAGTQSFKLTLVDALGQTADQTVNVTITAAGGTGGGTDGGNETDGGGTGGGTSGGNETDGGDGSGSGSGGGGLAFTGTPFLLVGGLLGGVILLLVGTGLVTGDRLRTARGPAGTAGLASIGLAPLSSTTDLPSTTDLGATRSSQDQDGPRDPDPHAA